VSIEIVVVLSSFIISALHAFVRRNVKRHPSPSCGTMPASSIIHAAFFALGAAVGGGTVVAISASRKKEALVRAQALPPTGNGPLVEVGVTGNPRLSQAAGASAALAVGPVLKYGNPGMYDTLMATISVNELVCARSHFRPTCAPSVYRWIRSSLAASFMGQFKIQSPSAFLLPPFR
jgi:hypothetical protein